jgi:hypothetical protein
MFTQVISVATQTMLTLYIEMENLGVVVKTTGMRNLLFIQTDCVNIAVISWRRIRNTWWGKSNSLLANRADKGQFLTMRDVSVPSRNVTVQ